MQFILCANKDTVAKSAPVQSTEAEFTFPINEGEAYFVEEPIKTDRHYQWKQWFFWEEDIEVYKAIDKNKPPSKPTLTPKELTPFYTQRDNKRRPYQTCNMTSAAMVINGFYPNLKPKSPYRQLEDELTNYCEQKYGYDGIYLHSNIVKVLAQWGVKSVFDTNTSFEDAKKNLDRGNPCIYSGKFTNSGHIIVLVDYNEKGFIVNDPYGEWWNWGYENKSGERLQYSYDLISNVSYSGRDKGWLHLCSKIEV